MPRFADLRVAARGQQALVACVPCHADIGVGYCWLV